MNDCVFCEKIREGSVEQELHPVYRNVGVYSFEPLNPVTEGHRLFVASECFALPHNDPGITGLVFNMAATYATGRYSNYNLIVNAGPEAGQTINHVHVHLVPRREGDGLKLPWTEQIGR